MISADHGETAPIPVGSCTILNLDAMSQLMITAEVRVMMYTPVNLLYFRDHSKMVQRNHLQLSRHIEPVGKMAHTVVDALLPMLVEGVGMYSEE
jgi:hypothetical protein